MLTLIQNADVYAPAPKGLCDILVAGETVAHIAKKIEPPAGIGCEVINAEANPVIPGLIDLHVHLLGGGGEGGFATRTPEITLSTITAAGVTTVVGCLGTDDISRHPESLLAKALQLTGEGISAYMYTGSYQLPPVTITGSVKKDIAFIGPVIGVGEVALSDHRSSQPGFEQFCQLAAQARVGGMIGGKAGLVHLHMGGGARRLEMLFQLAETTEIPITQLLPTHVTRTSELLDDAIRFARHGGNIDLTVKGPELSFALDTETALEQIMAAGVGLDQVTLSSDANGSMPVFDSNGNLLRLAVGDIGHLTADINTLIGKGWSLADVVPLVTRNPARRTGLAAKKGSLAPGKDADLVIITPDFGIRSVMARGRWMVRDRRVCVKGTFES